MDQVGALEVLPRPVVAERRHPRGDQRREARVERRAVEPQRLVERAAARVEQDVGAAEQAQHVLARRRARAGRARPISCCGCSSRRTASAPSPGWSSRNGPMRRVALPSGGSILITSAPSPASSSPVYSARSSAISMTRSPASMPGPALPIISPGPTRNRTGIGHFGRSVGRPATARRGSVAESGAGRDPRRSPGSRPPRGDRDSASWPRALQHLQQHRIELLRRLVRHPMPGTGDHPHIGIRPQRAQRRDALRRARIGRRIALAPDAVHRRDHLLQRIAAARRCATASASSAANAACSTPGSPAPGRRSSPDRRSSAGSG